MGVFCPPCCFLGNFSDNTAQFFLVKVALVWEFGKRRQGSFRAFRRGPKNTESTQFNPFPFSEGTLHTLKDGFHRHPGLGFGDSSLGGDFVDDIELAQSAASSVIVLQPLKRRSRNHGIVSMTVTIPELTFSANDVGNGIDGSDFVK